MAKKAKPAAKFTLPEGTIIYHSLFTKDQFDEGSKAAYKIEMAFPKGALQEFGLEDMIIEAAEAEWGELSEDEVNDLVWPIHDGDELAAKREKRGKNGDAYKGKDVIRANTIYNAMGVDGPGGIEVFDAELNKLDNVADQGMVYGGALAKVAVSIGTYQDNRYDRHGLKFYLNAVQITGEGERLGGNTDHSSLFKPVGRAEGEGVKRRARAG